MIVCGGLMFGTTTGCTPLDFIQTALLGVLTGTTVYLARNV
jgi:hypothetical protein